jgi:hypothetical protein
MAWTILQTGIVRNGHRGYVLARCGCGNEREVYAAAIRSGRSSQCASCSATQKKTTHGQSRTNTHDIWCGMVRRGTGKENRKTYADKGIGVTPMWVGEGGFERFFAHVGPRPSKRHTLDRINNLGNYEPGNVRWATWREQQQNRADNRLVTWKGETLPIIEWSRRLGLAPMTLHNRVRRLGWSIEQAFTEPVRRRSTSR